MFEQYHLFAKTVSPFYDWPESHGEFVSTVVAPPPGWSRERHRPWVAHRPDQRRIPVQGWKIHVSPRLEEAAEVLSVVDNFCRARGVEFKHLDSASTYRWMLSKYAPLSSAAKFIALYPASVGECGAVLADLSQILEGRRGPEVVGDLRYEGSILHVRYGPFLLKEMLTRSGEVSAGLADDEGRLHPDSRQLFFDPPPWVEIPSFLMASLAAYNAPTLTSSLILGGALSMSAAGGVYSGRRGSTDVVVKEGRADCGIDAQSRDARYRVRHEYEVLRQLDGAPAIPRGLDLLERADLSLLVMSRVPGEPAWRWVGTHNPLFAGAREGHHVTDRECASYVERVQATVEKVYAVVRSVHAEGLAVGDLHPGNLLIGAGDAVSLIDLEAARPLDSTEPLAMAAPGFLEPGLNPLEQDEFALERLRAWFYAPFNNLWGLVPGMYERHREFVAERFGVQLAASSPPSGPAPEGGMDPEHHLYRRDLRCVAEGAVDHPQAVVDSLVRGLHLMGAQGVPDRRIYGDVRQFEVGSSGLWYGTAGVLWALVAATGDAPRGWVDELAEQALAFGRPDPSLGTGLAGIGLALDACGRHETARRVLRQAWEQAPSLDNLDLTTGLAGLAVASLTTHAGLEDAETMRSVREVADRMTEFVDGHPDLTKKPGLLYGHSGAALMLSHLYDVDGDRQWLELACALVEADLARCTVTPSGSVQVDDRTRTLAYLAHGSGGMALVMLRLREQLSEHRWQETLPRIAKALTPEYVVEPQLLFGRAGMIGIQSEFARHGLEIDGTDIARHVSRLRLHQVAYLGELAFPGERGLAVSGDLATGTAGVLAALSSALLGAVHWFPGYRTQVGAAVSAASTAAPGATLPGTPGVSRC